MKKKVKKLKMTCDFCPSQWEGVLENDDTLYIRFRWGQLTAECGKGPIDVDFFENSLVFYSRLIGDAFDGVLSTDEMIKHLEDYLDFNGATMQVALDE